MIQSNEYPELHLPIVQATINNLCSKYDGMLKASLYRAGHDRRDAGFKYILVGETAGQAKNELPESDCLDIRRDIFDFYISENVSFEGVEGWMWFFLDPDDDIAEFNENDDLILPASGITLFEKEKQEVSPEDKLNSLIEKYIDDINFIYNGAKCLKNQTYQINQQDIETVYNRGKEANEIKHLKQEHLENINCGGGQAYRDIQGSILYNIICTQGKDLKNEPSLKTTPQILYARFATLKKARLTRSI